MTAPKLGFIGLGQIGSLIANHLVGWPGGLVVCDVREDATAPFAEQGAEVAPDAAAVARAGAEIISVMVLDDAQVREVVHALLPVAAAGTVIAVHSTISPSTAEDLAEEAKRQDVDLLDVPVSGGPGGASEGRLALLVGGDPDALERCREPFDRFSELIVHFGPAGTGTRAKIARNLLTFVGYQAAAEAQRLAEASGLSLRRLAKVVRFSDAVAGGPSSIMLRPTTAPAPPDDPLYDVLCHIRTLGEKDLSLALELGAELGVALPLTELTSQQLADGLGVPYEQPSDEPPTDERNDA
jgi:3-hydroxyisobutyrate dehydrogenase-like beta-hydroxyacid dehydrogenase